MAPAAEKLEQEKIYQTAEAKLSFDPLASINLMRFDIDNFGSVLPETKMRILDEECSYFAEAIDRHSYTAFTLKEDPEKGLVYFDQGKWRPYLGLLMTGLEVANREAEEDHRKKFLADWAARDLQKGYQMESLEVGKTMVWDNPFPHQEHDLYGSKFLNDCGLQSARKMGFIYMATRNQDGSVTIESHTVDNSDEDAFAAARKLREHDREATIHDLVRTYDDGLFMKYGQQYFAGRLKREGQAEENAWEFVERHKGLFEYYFAELEKIAFSELQGKDLLRRKNNLTVGIWKLTKDLLDGQTFVGLTNEVAQNFVEGINVASEAQMSSLLQMALVRAINQGEALIGCGGSIVADMADADMKEVFNAIFGENKSDSLSDAASSKTGIINCYKCRQPVAKKDVVKKDSWCCPKCDYEVDVCTGKVINPGKVIMKNVEFSSGYGIKKDSLKKSLNREKQPA